MTPAQKIAQQQQTQPPPMTLLRNFDDDNKQHLFVQTQNQKINEKMLDNQKLLLESLTNLPQNLLQSWIQSGQLQVSVDEGEKNAANKKKIDFKFHFYFINITDGMQSIQIPFAIQKENSTQEIITKKIPIKLLTGKIKTESE